MANVPNSLTISISGVEEVRHILPVAGNHPDPEEGGRNLVEVVEVGHNHLVEDKEDIPVAVEEGLRIDLGVVHRTGPGVLHLDETTSHHGYRKKSQLLQGSFWRARKS